jgi:hypothetical protein
VKTPGSITRNTCIIEKHLEEHPEKIDKVQFSVGTYVYELTN